MQVLSIHNKALVKHKKIHQQGQYV